jgi:hypothetical protein
MTSAHAFVINGACELDMTFSFSSSPTLTGSAPVYTVSIDPDSSECTLDTLDVVSTSGDGTSAPETGGTSLVHCGVLAGRGTWDQGFEDVAPDLMDGFHVVGGTWTKATMVVSSIPLTTFTGTIELTPHPDEPLVNAYKVESCRNGDSVTSIRMLGVQVFNDPTL